MNRKPIAYHLINGAWSPVFLPLPRKGTMVATVCVRGEPIKTSIITVSNDPLNWIQHPKEKL